MENETTTNEIMEFLKDNMATKEDLEGFATKEDLEGFATKQDLVKMQHGILDGLDDKFSDLKGDLVVLMRKEDKKVSELITVLREKQVLTNEEADRLLAMNPFPQVS